MRILQRIQRLTFLTLAAVFFVILLGTFILFAVIEWDSRLKEKRNATSLVTRDVSSELQQFSRELLVLARSDVVYSYGSLVRNTPPTAFGGPGLQIQNDFIQAMRAFVEQDIAYSAMRFITLNKLPYAEVTRSLQVIEVSPQSDTVLDGAILDQARMGAVGDVFFGPAQDGELAVYALIIGSQAGADPVGMLQLVISTDGWTLLDDVLRQPAIAADGRMLVLVNVNNQLITSTGDVLEDDIQGVLRRTTGSFNTNWVGFNTMVSASNIPINGVDAPWRVVLADNLPPTALFFNQNALIVAILLVITLVSVVAATRRVLKEQLQSVSVVRQIANRVVEGRAIVWNERTDDEFQEVYDAFAHVTERLQSAERDIAHHTRQYSRNLRVLGRVGGGVATLHNIDELLQRAIDLICTEFGFYHAQVFLIDDVGMNAVLVHSHGEVGRQLLEQEFKIEVGADSVIGTVTATGKPMLINNTTARSGQPHRFNPMLPNTKAELGLPLIVGGQIIGALDIQSTRPDAFEEQDMPIFSLLADQLSVAIYNARLINQGDKRIAQIDSLNRQLTRGAWQESDHRDRLKRGYRYNLVDVEPIEEDSDEKITGLSSPISVRGEVIGTLVASPTKGQEFTEGDEVVLRSVAERVALALENARLFDVARVEAERAQSEAQRALALAEAAQLASRIGDDFGRGLDEVFQRVAEVVGFNRWMLMLVNEENDRLDKVIVRTPALSEDADLSYSIDDVAGIPLVDAFRLNQQLMVNAPLEFPGDEISDFYGKHIAVPVRAAMQVAGALFMGRDLDSPDLDERDQQVVETLAAQVGIAIENRHLFDTIQNEQQTLSSILETLPAGVLVLNPQTLKPELFNQQAQHYLGTRIDPSKPFTTEAYNLYRTGTHLHYPEDELPIFTALRDGTRQSSDDVAVILDDHQIDLVVDAAPIKDARGRVTGIVAALQDISSLRSLENTLQENLRETVSLYEAQRQFTEAESLDDVLDALLIQLMMVQPTEAYLLLANPAGQLEVVRYITQPFDDIDLLEEILNPDDMVRITDIYELNDQLCRALDEMGIRSVVTMPIRASFAGRSTGWMVFLGDSPNYFTENLDTFLSQLSDAASTALDNRYLIQTQQATLREIQNLYGANASISGSRGLEQLTTAIREALEALASDYYAGYVEGSSDINQQVMELFNVAVDGATAIDLNSLLQGYELPRRGLFVDDLAASPDPDPVEQSLLEAGIRAYAAINLYPQDIPGGCLVVAYRTPHRFSDGEMRYLTTVSDSASIVFNNILLFNQIQGALEETSILYQAGRALSDISTPAEVLDVIVDYLIAGHINQVFIALLNNRDWDDPAAIVDIVASWSTEGIDLEGVSLTAEQFPAWSKLAAESVLAINDVYEEGVLTEMEQIGIESLDARSLVVIPLRAPGRAIGAIWLGSQQTYHYTEREFRTFQAFSEQASLTLEAAYLLEQTEHRARQLATTAEVTESAGRILDLEELLTQVVNLIKSAFGYDHVQIFLMDDMDEYAELRASTGEPGEQLLAIKHKLAKGSDSVIGMVTERGQPQIALDTAAADVIHRPNPYLPLTRSEMAIPLIVKNQVVGALDVQSNQPNAFSEDDVQVLTTLAAQISVAIDNARLYKDAQEQAGRMGFLFEVTTAAAGAETLDEALNNVSERLLEMLGAISATIYLPQIYVDDFDHTFTTLKAVALSGSDQPLSEIEEIREDDKDNLINIVQANLQPFVVADIQLEPRYLPIVPSARSAVLLPLISANELIGLIVVEDERVGAFEYDILQLMLTMTGSLSAIVQSSLLLEQLQKTNDQLRELDRLKSDFLANMSHELRTPLNSIIGFSRVMLKGIDGSLTEMQEQDLTTIYNSGQHLLMLINDILDQAKIAAGKLDLKLDYFEIKPLVEAVKSIGIGLIKDKNINLIIELAPNLPKVYGDEFRTRQVLLNLVSNAAKFTNEGTIMIRVYPFENEERSIHMVRIDVEDSGIGIAEKDLPLLFEAFRQVDSSLTRTQGGTGLGLPIAKSLVEMQGGEMLVASEVNAGSTFSLTIPTMPVVDDDAVDGDETDVIDPATRPATIHIEQLDGKAPRDIKPAKASPISTQVMPAKREILLIEDDKNMVDQFRRALQLQGFEVQTADHPTYTEAMVSNLRPNVIIMDVNFADGEGWNLLQRLKDRDDTFDIPIIVVTLSSDSKRAYQLGAYAFIQRPFVPEDLVDVVLKAEKESNTERILIIDDQPEAVRLLTQLLNENGSYRVFSANTGLEGISLVARRHPHLIILDLRMPEMDGFAVLEELRSNPETANIPVMVVTGEIDLKADEQQQLSNVHVLHKTQFSEEEYEQFICDVRRHLNLEE